MAKVTPNPALEGIHGSVGRLVFRKFYGKTVVSFNAHERHERKPTLAEEPQIDRFRHATLRAKDASPEMCARYRERAKLLNKPAYAVRTADYMHPPVIESVILAGYTGRPGEVILVRAKDDFEVKDVTVTLRLPGGEILESGTAQPTSGDAELFLYRTTAAPSRGSEVTVTVVARDWPNNEATRSVPWVIPQT